MIATYNQDIEAVKLLIDAGADVNIQDTQQNTPFLYAGAEGYLTILKMTIQAGADPTILNRYGEQHSYQRQSMVMWRSSRSY